MIVDWVEKIIAILSNDKNKESFLYEMEGDLKDILDAAWVFDTVIVRFGNGFYVDIKPLYSDATPDIQEVTKDFTVIKNYNEIVSKKEDALKELINAAKKHHGATELVETYLMFERRFHSLYSVEFVKSGMRRNDPKEIPFSSIKAFLIGLLHGFGVDLPKSNYINLLKHGVLNGLVS